MTDSMRRPRGLNIENALSALSQGQLTASSLTEDVLAACQTDGQRLGAFLAVDREGALRAAHESDERRRAGHAPRPLEGIPVALKDVLVTQGLPTTAGSRILEGFVPTYDGTVVRKLREAGAVIVGKTNLDEFAMGSSTENSAFLPARNPWDETRTPGGSSGGSAVAVAAHASLGAIGTDTGGSIRQPAAHCGVVGLKPTYGRVSRYGVVAFASSLAQVGPFGRTVADVARLLEVIAGHDPQDATSVPQPVPPYSLALGRGIAGLRIGIPREYFIAGIDPAVENAVRQALAVMEGAGAQLIEVSLPHTRYALSTYYLIAPAEASSNLARYDGVRYGYRDREARSLGEMYDQTRAHGFGAEVRRRIMLGTFVLSAGYYDAYYLKAQKVRTLIRRDFEQAFATCDVIATPTAPTPAFKLGEKTADPIAMYLTDVFTLSCNLAGLPGLSVPCGLSPQRLPIGLQLLAPPFQEEQLLATAHAYESLRGPFPGPFDEVRP